MKLFKLNLQWYAVLEKLENLTNFNFKFAQFVRRLYKNEILVYQ